ncbi:putative inner membrane protein [Citrobacter koseri]|nr:putative inner membrane protein [Citrobacter koseri]
MSWQQFKQAWLVKFWAPVPAVIAAGILSTYYFGITGTFWAVTGEFTRWVDKSSSCLAFMLKSGVTTS